MSIYGDYHPISEIDDFQKAKAAFESGELLMVLVQDSMTYDDGYGDRHSSSMSTLRYMRVLVFETQKGLENWMIENHSSNKFKVFRAAPVPAKLRMTLELG